MKISCLPFSSLLLVFHHQVVEVRGQDFVGLGALCTDVNNSLTCDACPDCEQAVCADSHVTLPPMSEFWPPIEFGQKTGPDPIEANLAAELDWFEGTVLNVLPSATKQTETMYNLTSTEETLVLMDLMTWQAERAAGTYTCTEMATALTKRAMYLQEVQKMNHFMYWTGVGDFDWVDVVLEQAAALDTKAEEEGVESIAPLYCYPVPLKGTMVTKLFPSSSGFAALHDKFGVVDAALVTLIANANGVLFGKTNVPELAHVSCVCRLYFMLN